jgi:membrane protein DedA with SNARE-associated domain
LTGWFAIDAAFHTSPPPTSRARERGDINKDVVVIASLSSGILNELSKLPSGLVYAIVFLLVFGEAALFVGFVLPGETAVLVAGAIASTGHLNIWFLCALVVVAAIIGDSVGFFVGERYGHKLLTLPVIRHRQAALHKALDGLQRRGPTYVFMGRFTAFLRAVMPGLAGMSRMHYGKFLFANAAGGLLWGIGFTLLGYFAGSALTKIEKYASRAGIVLLVLVVAFFIWHHLRTKRRERAEEAAWEAEHGEISEGDEDQSPLG